MKHQLLLLLLIGLIVSSVPASSQEEPGNKIHLNIQNENDLTSLAQERGWKGNGSQITPFIVENLRFEIGVDVWDGIRIENTRSHILLQNIEITGQEEFEEFMAIHLNNVANIQLVNITITNSYVGAIDIYDSSNISISDTKIGIPYPDAEYQIYYGTGISLGNVSSLDIRNLRIENYREGVGVYRSHDITISKSLITTYYHAITIYDTSQIAVQDSDLYQGGVNLGLFSLTQYASLKIENIMVNDKPLVYLFNSTGSDIQEAGQVIVAHSTNVQISGLEIGDVDVPVFVHASRDISIEETRFTNIKEVALRIMQSSAIEITNNTISQIVNRAIDLETSNSTSIIDNQISALVSIDRTHDSTIEENYFHDTLRGIWLAESYDTRIRYNTFANVTLPIGSDGYGQSSKYDNISDNYYVSIDGSTMTFYGFEPETTEVDTSFNHIIGITVLSLLLSTRVSQYFSSRPRG